MDCREREGTCSEVTEAALSLLQFFKLFSADDANGKSKSVYESKVIRAALQKKVGCSETTAHPPTYVKTHFLAEFLQNFDQSFCGGSAAPVAW